MADGRELKITEISSICSTLEQILRPGFGPNGLGTMLTTSTGHVMVANDSWTILNSLTLSHPVGRMITDSVKNHLKLYGDGGKAFILIMSKIFHELSLSEITKDEQQDLIRSLNRLRDELPTVMKDLISECTSLDLNSSEFTSVKEHCRRIIMIQLSGSFPSVISEHLCSILLTLIFDGLTDVMCLLSVILDAMNNFDICCIEAIGYPPTSSQVIEGCVIQRTFQTIAPDLSSKSRIRFLLFSCSLDGDVQDDRATYSVKNESSLHAALMSKAKIIELVVQRLIRDDIDLLISSVNISRAVSLACHAANISTIQMVDDEEMARLSKLFGLIPINLLHEYLTDDHCPVGMVSGCDYVLINGHKFIHLIPNNSDVFVKQDKKNLLIMKHILVAGHSRGACCQIRTVFQNCLKHLHKWLTSDTQQILDDKNQALDEHQRKALLLTSCGTFELFLYFRINALFSSADRANFIYACKLISRALLQVPLALQNNSYHPVAKTLNVCHILKEASGKNIAKLQINPRSGRLIVADYNNGAEPLVPKVIMLYNMLDLVVQILRLDKLVPVQLPSKS
ncbi:hypothetical protein LSH36_230g04029 [Paralvinella palmiformis]|uniref:Bardet-Biedl syndrome 10 protein n=1 Tax=Paralvinella palmiformis TaxID=53620 RepID=A0AAD9JN62_9ANNE|nr:hypothetical protein LSH36_230g04029 [Paralvinella palmiformis]